MNNNSAASLVGLAVRFVIRSSSEFVVSRPTPMTSAQPPQSFKIIVEGLYKFGGAIRPLRFNCPLTVIATQRYAEEGLRHTHAERSHAQCPLDEPIK